MQGYHQHECIAGFWSDQAKRVIRYNKPSRPGRLHWTLNLLNGAGGTLVGETDDPERGCTDSPMHETYYRSVSIEEPDGLKMIMKINMHAGEVALSAFSCLLPSRSMPNELSQEFCNALYHFTIAHTCLAVANELRNELLFHVILTLYVQKTKCRASNSYDWCAPNSRQLLSDPLDVTIKHSERTRRKLAFKCPCKLPPVQSTSVHITSQVREQPCDDMYKDNTLSYGKLIPARSRQFNLPFVEPYHRSELSLH
jgi:hypothetical protein